MSEAAAEPNRRIVQKFGGSSLATPERINHVAGRVAATAASGVAVCVVVSAMGDTTDELIALAAQVSGSVHAREADMLLAAGEQISIALLTMALLDRGLPAVSLTGPQAGILTDSSHGNARIIGMRADRVAAAIERGEIPIVAGFQGLSQDTRPRRDGHDSCRARRCARRRCLRDLHRRRRRVHGRSTARPERAEARAPFVP
jgi:aspartate kinase